MTKQTYKRRTYLLLDSSQPRVLLMIEILFLVMLVISGIVLFVLFNQDLTSTYLQAHIRVRNVRDILLPTLVIVNVVALILSAILMLFYTHRIVGPVYRLCRILRQVGQGNLAQVTAFRQGDELKELERATGDMLTGLNERMRHLQSTARGADALIETIRKSYPDLVELDYMAEIVSEIEKTCASFQLKSDIQTL